MGWVRSGRLDFGVNMDSPSTVTKDKAVSNHPGKVVSVNLETCATVFLNVSVSFTETESKVFPGKLSQAADVTELQKANRYERVTR